ncbi:hypothetical protein [Marinobacter sp. BSs20148]|uniref:hypothetical protein n=1 Tax=Marinobacter sp. BSs20148 TaxID=490759 RepID=UPI0039B61172
MPARFCKNAEYSSKAGGSSRQPAVFRLRSEERVKASAVVMKDYTFKKPAYAMLHEHHAALANQRQDYQRYAYFQYAAPSLRWPGASGLGY